MTETKPKRASLKQFIEAFRALSRQRQDAFLKAIYDQSPQNKALFKVYLNNDNKSVLDDLLKDIQKETTKRIGRYRKIRFAKINEILRNAEKFALNPLQIIELRRETWTGILAYNISRSYIPERYHVACARHLDLYISAVKDHVLETSEKEEILEKDKAILIALFKKHYIPWIEDVYIKHFNP